MNKVRVLPKKGTYKYFQPVITNNTMVVSAKVEDNKEEALEKNKVYKYKVNLSDSKDNNVKTSSKNKEDDINNKVIENIREQLKKEIAASKSEKNEDEKVVAEETKAEKASEDNKIEDFTTEEAKVSDEKIEEAKVSVDKIEDEVLNETANEEKNIEDALKESTKLDEDKVVNAVEDVTTKMDLPNLDKKQENSVPVRRETPDNIKEFKVKLFLLATNAKKPVRIMVNRKRFLIGSDFERMDCVIRNNQYISRCHAKIHYESDCYYIEDAGSMNGTYINGVKLAEGLKYKLISGDIINLADCRFEVSMR